MSRTDTINFSLNSVAYKNTLIFVIANIFSLPIVPNCLSVKCSKETGWGLPSSWAFELPLSQHIKDFSEIQ